MAAAVALSLVVISYPEKLGTVRRIYGLHADGNIGVSGGRTTNVISIPSQRSIQE